MNTITTLPELDRVAGHVHAAQRAARLDRARDRALEPGQPFEVLGLDLAESLEHLAIRLETEIYGPADRRQGGSNER